jgi:hypothetical protein
MKIRLSEFRQIINQFISEALEEMEKESVDRLRRAQDGYGETAFEEDTDRLRRAKDGYGETEFEESTSMISKPQAQSSAKGSAALHSKDKSKMQGVGPRPNLANAFGDQSQKKETTMISKPQPQSSAKKSASLHSKDKSQMQGVGPRPSLSTAFGNEKQEDLDLDPNKTAVLPPDQRPNSDEAEKQFNANQLAQKKAAEAERRKQNIEKIKTVHSPAGQKALEKDGWKITRQAGGNWSALPPERK